VGQLAYNPKALLKIDLMGVWEGILSSRKLEQTKVNDVYRFLSGVIRQVSGLFAMLGKKMLIYIKKLCLNWLLLEKGLVSRLLNITFPFCISLINLQY
jgi:hypothetical protein